MRSISTPAALIIIVLAGAFTLGRVVRFDFTTWDDHDTVLRNPQLNPPTARSIQSFWTEPHMDLYVPVTYTVWALVANSSQGPTGAFEPRGFHLLNLAMHLTAGCVAFLLLRELLQSATGALFGALLFVLHPLQVESVAWISGMKDVLFGLLSLGAMWQYVRLAREQTQQSLIPSGEWWGRYLIATALFVLAMLSKPTAMVVPPVLVALDCWIIGRSWKRVLAWLWPWFALAIPIAIVAKLSQPAHAIATVPHWLRPLIAGDAISFYLFKLVVPTKLTFDYGRTPDRVLESGRLWWTWVVPAMTCALLLRFHRRARPVLIGATVMVLVLAPVLGLVPFDFQGYSTVADHYMYLAMLGPAMGVGWLVAQSGRVLTRVVVGLVLILLAARSFDQTRHWRDSSALYSRALQVNPVSFATYNNLAVIAFDQGRVREALELSRRAVDLNPRYAPAHNTYADALRQTGNAPAAIEQYREALKYETVPSTLSNLAALLAGQGNFTEAIPLARKAVEMDPRMLSSRMNLAKMYLGSNDDTAARRELDAVLKLDPNNAEASHLRSQVP